MAPRETLPIQPGNWESLMDYLGTTALTGATALTRYVGGTTVGAPTTGTFAVGDFVIDQTGIVWICTAAGTPGTWRAAISDPDNYATGIMVPPNGATQNAPNAIAASRCYAIRFVARKPFVVGHIAFSLNISAGANDNCDVGIFSGDGLTLFGSAGTTAGKLNALAGIQTLALTAPVTLVPNTVYYAAFAAGTFGGAAATLATTVTSGPAPLLMGGTLPNMAMAFQATAFPLTAPFTAAPNAINNCPVLALLA